MSDTAGNLPEIQIQELPSKFIPYEPGSVIKYRPFTFGEVKKMASSKLGPAEQIRSSLVGIMTTFPVTELTFADMMYIVLSRKLSSFGTEQFEVKYQCPTKKCGHVNEFKATTADIDFDDMKAPSLPLITELSGYEFQFKPITVEAYLRALKRDKHEDDIFLYASLIVEEEGKPHTQVNKAYDILQTLSGDDQAVMTEIDELLYHGVKPMKQDCPKCGNTNEIEIETGGVLLAPFRKPTQSTGSRIRFGLQGSGGSLPPAVP